MTDSSEGSTPPDPIDPFGRSFRAGLAVLTILMGLYMAYTAAKWLFPLQKLEAVDAHLKLRQNVPEPADAGPAAQPAASQPTASPAVALSAAARRMSADAEPAANGAPAAPASAVSNVALMPLASHTPQAASGHSAAGAPAADAGRSAALTRNAVSAGSESESSRQQAGQPSRLTTGNAVTAETKGDFLQRNPASAGKPTAGPGSMQALQPFPASYRGGLPVQPAADGRPGQNPVSMMSNGAAANSPAKGSDVVQAALQASSSLQAKGAYLAAQSGLCPSVALAWVVKENGVNNNILGVSGNGGLNKYATWQEGLDAAVALLRTSSYYRGIMAAIASGDCCAQRDAIVASPWSGASHYGHGANFPNVAGCHPYGQ